MPLPYYVLFVCILSENVMYIFTVARLNSIINFLDIFSVWILKNGGFPCSNLWYWPWPSWNGQKPGRCSWRKCATEPNVAVGRTVDACGYCFLWNEPRHEKLCLWDFRPGPTNYGQFGPRLIRTWFGPPLLLIRTLANSDHSKCRPRPWSIRTPKNEVRISQCFFWK